MPSSAYSKTPLAKKLGIKSGFKVKLINAPVHYFDLFEDLPKDLLINTKTKHGKNFIHFFVKDVQEFTTRLPSLIGELDPNGMIWVSWPKKSSGVVTDMGEQMIRDFALANGLVDIKVCAIDEVWSGLKLVIPLKDRKAIQR